MLRLALKSALGKKMRLISTALSVLIGVAFLSGTLIFTDTIRRTFNDLFASVYESTDSVVRSTNTAETSEIEQRDRLPGAFVEEVAAVPGVDVAAGLVTSYAQIIDRDGDAIGDPGQGAPTFGMSDVPAELSPWTYTEGSRPPRSSGEVAIDLHSADVGHLSIGDRIQVVTQTGVHDFTLVGTVKFGSADSPGGASVSLFDLATAQDVLLGGTDEIDIVMVHAAAGVTEEQVTASIAAVLPAEAEAITGEAMISEAQDQVAEGLDFFATFLLVFAGIGLVVATFTIYNTFQIVVSQRLREMSLIRSIGATRRQVMATQMIEALVIGLTASLGGLFAGLGMAGLLRRMMDALGFGIPTTELVFLPRTVIAGLAVGVLVTLLSAIVPSLRASRTPPLGTAHEIGIERTAQRRRRLLVGGGVTLLGGSFFVVGLAEESLPLVGLGAFVVFIGVFVLGPTMAAPGARLIGAPVAAVGGVTGSIARRNAARNPKRTARTGGALMIGVALVVAVAMLTASVKDWVRDIYGETFAGDFVVSTNTTVFGGLSPRLADELNALPEVDAAAGVRFGIARDADGNDVEYKAIDPALADRLFDFGFQAGSFSALTSDGIVLDDDEAIARDVGMGETVTLTFLDGVSRTLEVVGIYTDDDLAGPMVIANSLHESTGVDQFDFSVFVLKTAGVSDAAAGAAIAVVAANYPNGTFRTRDDYIDAQAAQIDPLVNLMYGLLGLAVIIALLSIANSMALSIHERSRELGLLRAVGMTRAQLRRSVAFESFVIGVFGTVLGVLVGAFFGWSMSVVLRGDGLANFQLPVRTILVVAALAVIGGLLAAAKPGWHASRLDVLRAITSE